VSEVEKEKDKGQGQLVLVLLKMGTLEREGIGKQKYF